MDSALPSAITLGGHQAGGAALTRSHRLKH